MVLIVYIRDIPSTRLFSNHEIFGSVEKPYTKYFQTYVITSSIYREGRYVVFRTKTNKGGQNFLQISNLYIYKKEEYSKDIDYSLVILEIIIKLIL